MLEATPDAFDSDCFPDYDYFRYQEESLKMGSVADCLGTVHTQWDCQLHSGQVCTYPCTASTIHICKFTHNMSCGCSHHFSQSGSGNWGTFRIFLAHALCSVKQLFSHWIPHCSRSSRCAFPSCI